MSDGKIYYITGSSRSGKSTSLFKQLRKYKRIFIWDIKGEFCRYLKNVNTFQEISQVKDFVKQHKKGAGRVAFQSLTLKHFDLWAKLAFAWAQFAPCAIVLDESSDITQPGKARGYWGIILKRVLCTGSDVFVVSQRPTESESTSTGNASVIICYRLSRPSDRKIMSNYLDVPASEIQALKQYEYIERDMNTHESRRGKTVKPA